MEFARVENIGPAPKLNPGEQRVRDASKVPERQITSTFRRRYFKLVTENRVLGCILINVLLTLIPIIYLPKLLRLRMHIRKYRKENPNRKPRVVYWTDTLDEVNGISNNIRLTVGEHLDQKRPVNLIGAVTRHRFNGKVENHYVMLLPLLFAMPQLGYPDSELSIPHLAPLLGLIRRYPPDVVELETPNPGSWLMLSVSKILGVKVISHYRTDGVGYTRLLVKFKPMQFMVHFWITVFNNLTRPIIVPSKDFTEVVHKQTRVPKKDIVQLPRGIDLDNFFPERNKGLWTQYNPAGRKVRFLSVGRISKEKALPFMESSWRKFRERNPDAELTVVGAGPYLEEMRERMKDCPEVAFSGRLSGKTLFSLYAEADYFLFPSGNDTFGNVLIEAMASGTPVLVSDRGGPKEIIENKDVGFILPFNDEDAWVEALNNCVRMKTEASAELEGLRERAIDASKEYSLNNACNAHWDYLCDLTGLTQHKTTSRS